MSKYWILNDSKTNKLIFIKDQCIYKGNPKQDNFNVESSNLEFLKSLFSIPYSYIKQVENQSGKNEIKIFFGQDSEEELIINDENIKKEIFEFLRYDISNFTYSSEVPSVIKYAKPQFFALLFTTVIFIWSLYLAIQIDNGSEYILLGTGKVKAVVGTVIAIASLGVFKITIGFLFLSGIIIFALTKRLKSRSETEFLKR